jgi:signal transduction histidine kinase
MTASLISLSWPMVARCESAYDGPMNAWLGPRRSVSVLFAVAVAGGLQLVVWTDPGFAGARVWSCAAALAFGVAMLLWRRLPLVPLAVGLVILCLPSLHVLANSAVLALGIMGTLYSCGVQRARSVAFSGLGLGAVAVVVSAITADPFLASDSLWVAVITVAPWAAGRLVRRDRDRAELLEALNVRLEEQQEQREARASAEERLRIARELHDVIAHALSVVVVQARSGRRMVNRDRKADAAEGFDAVESAAQRALGEMRRLLGVLRSSDHAAEFAPTPGLARLPELIARAEDAGLTVEVEVDGDPRDLPAGIDVSAYRIVQEALTNVVRHAGASRARLTITYHPDAVTIDITDDGRGNSDGSNAPGHGLAGIRERVSIYGGDLNITSPAAGGYSMTVRLPSAVSE